MRSSTVVPALLVALLLCAPAAASKQRSRELYHKGMAEYVLEHWSSAIRLFEAGFREQPEAAFLYNIAQAHRRSGHPADAVRYFRKYLDFKPDAADRREVEETIVEQEQLLAAPSPQLQPPPTAAPPLGATGAGPPPAATTAPPTVAAAALQEAAVPQSGAPAAHAASRSRWPLWVGLGVGALLLAGGAVALTVAYTTPNDAPIPGSSVGNVSVSFP